MKKWKLNLTGRQDKTRQDKTRQDKTRQVALCKERRFFRHF